MSSLFFRLDLKIGSFDFGQILYMINLKGLLPFLSSLTPVISMCAWSSVIVWILEIGTLPKALRLPLHCDLKARHMTRNVYSTSKQWSESLLMSK